MESLSFVVLHDETQNRITKDEQIDIMLRFWTGPLAGSRNYLVMQRLKICWESSGRAQENSHMTEYHVLAWMVHMSLRKCIKTVLERRGMHIVWTYWNWESVVCILFTTPEMWIEIHKLGP